MYNRQEMRRALESRDWSRVRKLMDCGEAPSALSQTLIEDTIQSGCLIEPRHDEKDVARRDMLIRELLQCCEDSADGESKERLENHIKDAGLIERCYREIRRTLKASAIAKRTPQVQAWAAIARLVEELNYVQAKIDAALTSRSETRRVWLLDSNPWRLTGPTGKPIEADAAVNSLARHLGMTLRMLAHENHWFSNKRIVLPSRVDVDEGIIFESGINSLLAHCWCRVEDSSEHIRYLGGEISQRRVAVSDSDQDAPREYEAVRFDMDFGLKQWELVARSRLDQMFVQNFMNLRGRSELQSRIRDIQEGPVALPLDSFVSEHELVTVMFLQMAHHLSQIELSKNYDGLTMFEWIRCYCLLRYYCNRDDVTPALQLRELDLAEFRQTLRRASIDDQKAQEFIDSIIFQTGKRDLYDAPVMVDADGRYWLLAPLFASANVAEIVLSQLSSHGASFDSKGSTFEETIRDAFRARSIPVKGFKYHHDGKQYECDAAVLWGKHLFIFECKNDFLPTSRPQLSYFFWLDMVNAGRQVMTIASHFIADRSLIRRHFHADDWEEIHPVVLSALPFSLPMQVEGAYFYDASALLRFLTDGAAGLAQHSPDNRFVVQAPLAQLWLGDEPAPEDLIAQIKKPLQLTQFDGRMDIDWFRSPISQDFLIEVPALKLQPITPEKLLAAFGYSAESIEKFEESISDLSDAIQKLLT
jgi:hypothetical protein